MWLQKEFNFDESKSKLGNYIKKTKSGVSIDFTKAIFAAPIRAKKDKPKTLPGIDWMKIQCSGYKTEHWNEYEYEFVCV